MKKKSKNELWNLVFSAFLVTAFMVCAYFFVGMINDAAGKDAVKRTLLLSVVFVLFGLMLFYATRVGDGKQVWRFSAATLVLMVLPALYVILASAISGMPFHEQIASRTEIVQIAGVMLGYGIPYTFLSGYELDCSSEDAAPSEEISAEETAEEPAEEPDDEEESSDEEAPAAEEPDEYDAVDEASDEGKDEAPEETDETVSE